MSGLEKSVVSSNVQKFVMKVVVDFSNLWKVNIQINQNYFNEICDGVESIVTKGLYNK